MRPTAAVYKLAATLFLTLTCGFIGCDKSQNPSAPKQIRMAGIIFQEDQFFRLILFGMKDAAKKNNIQFLEGNSD
ncbi:MAG TPA: hypothetical protein VGG44_10820, partial [Tepidisphaeraceae bacterium]